MALEQLGMEQGTKVRIPTDEFHTADQPGRRRRTRRAAPASVVWAGTVVESSGADEHRQATKVSGVQGERALKVRFDTQEPYELVVPVAEEVTTVSLRHYNFCPPPPSFFNVLKNLAPALFA